MRLYKITIDFNNYFINFIIRFIIIYSIIMEIADLSPYWLTSNQSLVYQIWLQYWTRQVTTLARFCGLHRVLTYNTLQELCKMGLATTINKWSTGYYTMQNPSALKEKLQEKLSLFDAILPSLQGMIKQSSGGFQVQSFAWIEWLKTLYDFLPHSKTDLKSFLWADHIQTEFRDYLYNIYLPKRLSRGIHLRAIVSLTEHNKHFADAEVVPQTETLIIPDNLFDLNSEIILFDEDKILIASMSETEMSGLLIQSKNLFFSLEQIFELLWRMYKK